MEAKRICKKMLIIIEKQESGDKGGCMVYFGNQRILAAGSTRANWGGGVLNSSQISEFLKLSF